MECILRHIHRYPFPLNKENNILGLSYTCFADPETADQLMIESHGFRFIRNDLNQELMLLVIRDHDLQSSQVDLVLHVPFQVLRQFSEPHPQVILTRKIVKMESPLLPKLREVQEINLYFNAAFEVDPALTKALTQSSFYFRSGEVYLQLSWLKPCLSEFKNIRSKLQLNQQVCEHDCGRYRHYFRVYIQAVGQTDPDEYLLFRNKATKVNLKTNGMHPFNLYRSVVLDKVEREIFELEPYQAVEQALRVGDAKNRIVLLSGESDAGISRYLHWLSQHRLGLNFWPIDCRSLPSTTQFYASLSWVLNLQSSLVLVEGLDWLQELYQGELLLSMEMKQIVNKIESYFREWCSRTNRNYTLVLMHNGKSISEDMFQECQTASIVLDKPMKLFIFKTIAQNQQEDPPAQDIVNYAHDKMGWEKFKGFLQTHWHQQRHNSTPQIVKALSKLVKQEQADNLMEVSWDDVGGLETAKQQIMQTILLPIRHPEIFDEWIKPRTGLLFYGPPGTGKTLLGKCIAKECKMSFISVKGPELLNMYVGESEKNVRQVFERAVTARPCIVFMDELDALIPKRGNSGDSNQVMDRIVAELLMQMDIASSHQVFVIGATNRPDLLDPSILRPGRFDKQIYLGITTNPKDKIKILKAQTRHLTLDEDVDWEQLLQRLPQNLTGADFYGLTSKAVMAAAQRVIEEYQRGVRHEKIRIQQVDFLAASSKVKPSVTEVDLRRYDQLKQIYS